MSLPATEPFTGTGALSGNWTVQSGTPSRSADALIGGSNPDNSAYWNADSFNNDQYAQGKYQGDVFPGVIVRASGTGGSAQCYAFVADDSFGGIYKQASGSFSLISGAGYNATYAAGDLLYLEVSGTTLTAKVNGSQVKQVTDSSYASGSAGLYCGICVTAALDDWEGGNLAAAGTGSPLIPVAKFYTGRRPRRTRRAS